MPPTEFSGYKVNGFVKVLASDYSATLLNLTEPSTAGTNAIFLTITESMVGGRLQFGFNNYSNNYEPSGMYYDNVSFTAFGEGLGGAIPTLDNWGMLLMVMLMGVAGAVVLTRRN